MDYDNWVNKAFRQLLLSQTSEVDDLKSRLMI